MKVCAEVKQNRHPLIMYPLLKNLTVSVKNYLNADSNTVSTTEMYVLLLRDMEKYYIFTVLLNNTTRKGIHFYLKIQDDLLLQGRILLKMCIVYLVF